MKRTKQRSGGGRDKDTDVDFWAKPTEPEKTWEEHVEGKPDDGKNAPAHARILSLSSAARLKPRTRAYGQVRWGMLVMVVETFLQPEPGPVFERFKKEGRMMPAGIEYLSSWISQEGRVCYQLMEAASLEDLRPWVEAWDDIVKFEIVPVLRSQDFWATASTAT